MFKEHSDSYCDKCESGRYQPERGQKECLGSKCPIGQWGPIEQTKASESVCHNCLEGRYSENPGQELCHSCPSGLYSNEKSATSCLGTAECPAGKWGPRDATSSLACQSCPVGTYGDRSGVFECPVCPMGKYNLKKEQTACLLEPKCERWHNLERVSYTCVAIYPLDRYRILVAMGWLAVAVNLLAICVGSCQLEMVGCSPILGVISFAISIWISKPHPLNLEDGMKDWEYGALMAFFGITFVGWLWTFVYYYPFECSLCDRGRGTSEQRHTPKATTTSTGEVVVVVEKERVDV